MRPVTILSTELQLALSPFRTYRELVAETVSGRRLIAFRRPAFVALIIGTAIAMTSTERVTLLLVLSVTACWAIVPLLQMLAGTIIIASSPRRLVTMSRALDLLFLGHLPWSFWLLGVAAATTFARTPFAGSPLLELSALVPLAWTVRLVFAFCTTVLHATVREARLKTIAHQAVVWTIAGVTVLIGSGWTRVLGLFGE